MPFSPTNHARPRTVIHTDRTPSMCRPHGRSRAPIPSPFRGAALVLRPLAGG